MWWHTPYMPAETQRRQFKASLICEGVQASQSYMVKPCPKTGEKREKKRKGIIFKKANIFPSISYICRYTVF